MSAVLLVFALCASACLIGHLALLRSVLRQPAAAASADVPRPRRGAEIVWALVPAVALALVLVATWHRIRDAAPAPHHHAVAQR